jgi:16S rRNA (cytosine1402-N4)-methyltransferase
MLQLAVPVQDEGRREPVHRSVLAREVIDLLRCRDGRTYVDGTLGPGGHAEAILESSAPDGRVIGLDLDPDAIRRASERLAGFGERFTAVRSDFRNVDTVLRELRTGPVDGILVDLGFSAIQMLTPERGFGFSNEGPLDMRYDPSRGRSAADLLAEEDEASLRRLLLEYGEEKSAGRIARAIVRRREKAPLRTTTELAALVAECAPRRGPTRIHPATKTFQALRIAVNGELDGLDGFVDTAVMSLRRGGRLAVISFHSLEDRIVKHAMRALAHRCICPPGMPVCGCGRENIVKVVTGKAVVPSPTEVAGNPRSRSAKLRVVERT